MAVARISPSDLSRFGAQKDVLTAANLPKSRRLLLPRLGAVQVPRSGRPSMLPSAKYTSLYTRINTFADSNNYCSCWPGDVQTQTHVRHSSAPHRAGQKRSTSYRKKCAHLLTKVRSGPTHTDVQAHPFVRLTNTLKHKQTRSLNLTIHTERSSR